MPPTTVHTIMDDPLVGCLPIVQLESNAHNLLRSLLLRLRLFLEEKRSAAVGDQVIAESKKLSIPVYEYVLNEVQYELRRCQKGYNEAFETIVLNNWTKDLLKRYPEDVVWTFFRKVRANRKARKR